MYMLKLIKGKKEQKQKEQEKKLSFLIERYEAMDEKFVKEFLSKSKYTQKEQDDFISRLCFLRLRKCVYKYNKIKTNIKKCSVKELEDLILEFADVLHATMILSPKLLKQTFPISKTYDGEKYNCIDYFSTQKALKEFDENKPLVYWEENTSKEEVDTKTENALFLLLEYCNNDIRKFNLFFSLLRSEHMKRTTGTSLEEELMEEFPELKKSRITLHATDNGKKYFVDSKGKSFSAKSTIPRNWRVITTKK